MTEDYDAERTNNFPIYWMVDDRQQQEALEISAACAKKSNILAWTEDDFTAARNSNSNRMVALDKQPYEGGNVIGYMIYELHGLNLSVPKIEAAPGRPDSEQIMEAMLDNLIRKIPQQGRLNLDIMVDEGNDALLRQLNKKGFTACETFRDHIKKSDGTRRDGIVMRYSREPNQTPVQFNFLIRAQKEAEKAKAEEAAEEWVPDNVLQETPSRPQPVLSKANFLQRMAHRLREWTAGMEWDVVTIKGTEYFCASSLPANAAHAVAELRQFVGASDKISGKAVVENGHLHIPTAWFRPVHLGLEAPPALAQAFAATQEQEAAPGGALREISPTRNPRITGGKWETLTRSNPNIESPARE